MFKRILFPMLQKLYTMAFNESIVRAPRGSEIYDIKDFKDLKSVKTANLER